MRADPGAGPPAASAATGAVQPARSHLRLLALGLGGLALLVVTVLLGYAMIAARVPQHRAALEQLIRHETGLEISFSGLSVRWGWYGPEAVFHDIAVGYARPGPALHAPELIVALDAWRMARSGRFEAGRITFVNPDIDLSSGRATPAAVAAPGPEHDSVLDAGAKLLARWRGDRVDLAGGTMRLPAGGSAPPLIVSLRHAQLRRRAADWALEVQALLPDTLGADMQLSASVHGDMGQPHALQGAVRFSGERLVFGGWHGVFGGRALAAWLPGAGTGNVDLKLQVVHGTAVALNGTVRAESLEWAPHAPGAAPLRLPRLRAEWQSARRAGDWVLALHSLDVGAAEPLTSQLLLSTDGTVRGVVRAVPLALATDIARWQDAGLPFAQLALDGTVRELNFSWDGARAPGLRLHTLAQVEALSVASAAQDLALSGLAARVSGSDTRLLVELGASSAQILSTRAQPVRLDGLSVAARVQLAAAGMRWQAQTQDLQIHGKAMQVALRGVVAAGAPQDPGRVDAHVDLAETDAVMLAGLLGARTGSAFGIEADRISAGRILSGTLELHGPLYVDPALPRAPDEFHGALELRGVSLAGDESWPGVQELSARLDWRAERVEAVISDARSGSFRLSKAHLQWDPRPQGAVHFSGLLAGEAQEALQWLRDRPDLGHYIPAVQGVELRGATLLDVDVRLAAQRAAAPKVRVTAVLDGAQLAALAGIPPVLLQHGTLAFADGHLQRSSLTGQWLGGPVSLNVAERRERGTSTLAITARGSLDARQALTAVAGSDADALLSGNADWTAQLSIVAAGAHASGRWNLRADSALAGLASGLPEPFAKAAEASVPLHVELSGSQSTAQLRVAFGERLRAQLALARSADAWRIERGALRLGALAADLPAEAVLSIQGRIPRLDLPPYLALLRAGAADAALPPLQGDVSAGEVLLGGHTYPEVRVLARSARRGGEVELQSAQLSGAVRWPEGADAQPARLELARFDAAQVSELMQGGAVAAALAPVTRLSVEDLRWQGRTLGRLSALVTREAEDLAFREVRLTGASEDGRGSAGCHGGTCNLSFTLDSTDAQATLGSYGLRPDVEARHASLSGELTWRRDDASPLASLDGSLHMLITDGATRLAARDEGASFPLLVVPALLAGIAPEHEPAPTVNFTRLAASYELRDGVASTADLHLDGDAEMLVRARLGLLAGDYDGHAVVLRGEARLPKALRGLGATPKVAAAWLALRDWLSGGGERGRIELRLRGTWADPIVSTQ